MNRLIREALLPLGYPVVFKTYNGTAQEYIIFNYWSSPTAHADDNEWLTSYTIQIDFFTPGNFLTTAKQIESRMKEQGFMRVFDDSEYIDEVNMFRYFVRFNYLTNNREEL